MSKVSSKVNKKVVGVLGWTRFSLQEAREMRERYERGESTRQIAKLHEASPQTVAKMICLVGGVIRNLSESNAPTLRKANDKRKTLTPAQEIEVAELYKSGKNSEEIAKLFKTNRGLICRALEKLGINRRGKQRIYSLDESVFDNADSDSAAQYWIGFLITDGCIHSNSGSRYISLALSPKDGAHVEKFRSFLKSTHKMSFCGRRENRPGPDGHIIRSSGFVRLAFISERIADVLAKYGVVPRKTLKAKPERIANSPSFWRGCVDGDGWIHLNKKTTVPEIGLCGSLALVTQFSEFVKGVSPLCQADVRVQRKTLAIFSTSGHTAIPVIKALYDNDEIALDRKKKLALIAMTWVGKRRPRNYRLLDRVDLPAE